VISLTDFFDAASRRHNDVILFMHCQRYADCLVTTLCLNRTVHQHTTPCTCNSIELLRQETPNFLASNLWPPNSPDLSPVDYEIWQLSCNIVSITYKFSVDELKRRLIDVWCGLEQSIFDEAIDQWQGRHRACSVLNEDILSTACK